MDDRGDVRRGSRATVVFSCLGHLYIHLFTAFYFVIVLALEEEWQLPYHELIELWTLGSLLVGVAALPAGILSDKLGARTMMIVFFLGLGVTAVAAGLTLSPPGLTAALAGIGLFAAIYHPVGIPWLVRNTTVSRGKALGINGVFGALGSAMAGLVAGALIEMAGWRAAFIAPGIVSIVTGLWLTALVVVGRLPRTEATGEPASGEGTHDTRRVFAILLATMFFAGFIFHATQTSLPKFFEQRSEGLFAEGTFGVGVLVALVYTVGGLIQILGGHLADRLPLKWVYTGSLLLQIPALALASSLGGAALVVTATLMVMMNASALPAENLLLARHTPAHRHGLAFGLKFVLSFGAAPLAVQVVAWVTASSGQLSWVYVLLAGVAVAAFVFSLFLPIDRTAPAS